MALGDREENLLDSWKEIASYMKRSVRTCRRWEKDFELPVHRIDDSPNARVFAYKDAIDSWKKLKANQKSSPNSIKIQNRLLKYVLVLAPILLFIIGLCLLTANLVKAQQPFDFKIVQSKLVILDERGKILWDYDIEEQNLEDDYFYRRHFQTRKKPNSQEDSTLILPLIIIEDINNDGKNEVLFATRTQDEYGGGKLFCFNNKGEINWEFNAGQKINFGDETFLAFNIRGFIVNDIDKDSKLEIIVNSHAVHRYPTQLCVLNHKGIKIGEYWNSGQFSDLCLVDTNNDGKDELVVVGINNEYKKGCMIVFNPCIVRGFSPQQGLKYSSKETKPGSQLYYILFPRTDVDLNEYEVESICYNDVNSNIGFYVTATISRIIFDINYDFSIKNIIYSHAFSNKHRKLKASGKINSILGYRA